MSCPHGKGPKSKVNNKAWSYSNTPHSPIAGPSQSDITHSNRNFSQAGRLFFYMQDTCNKGHREHRDCGHHQHCSCPVRASRWPRDAKNAKPALVDSLLLEDKYVYTPPLPLLSLFNLTGPLHQKGTVPEYECNRSYFNTHQSTQGSAKLQRDSGLGISLLAWRFRKHLWNVCW